MIHTTKPPKPAGAWPKDLGELSLVNKTNKLRNIYELTYSTRTTHAKPEPNNSAARQVFPSSFDAERGLRKSAGVCIIRPCPAKFWWEAS